jgi:plastocyanin
VRRALLGLAAAFLVAALAAAGGGCGRERVVELRMRGYAFDDSNPTLSFHRGERVRFVVINAEETNVLHDFRIRGLGVECGALLVPGQRREISVVMRTPGRYVYDCCRHPGMEGSLLVAR